jgi:GT2 family glycosyltransferase/trans-aconitate methyltransferase
MKPVAIVSLLWGKNRNVFTALLGHTPFTVLSPRAMCDEADGRLIAEAGGQLRGLEDSLDEDAATRLATGLESLRATFEDVCGSEAWRELHQPHGMDADRLQAIFSDSLTARLLPSVLLVEALDAAARHYDIRLLVVNDDWQALPRAAVEWARLHGVPSLHLAHGALLSRLYTAHGALNADCVAVFGQRGAECYLDLGIAADRVVPTGNPAWDEYCLLPQVRSALMAGLREQYPLGQRPTVVYATTWVAWLSAYDHAGRFEEGVRAFLRSALALRESGRDWNFVIKDRPSNAGEGRQRVERIAADLGLSPGDYLYATDEALPWVACADVLVASDSNVLIEGMHAGTPGINLMNDYGLLMGPSFDAESGLLELDEETLPAGLLALVEDTEFRQSRIAAMRARLPHYNLGHDGSATLRVATLMGLLAKLSVPPAPAEAVQTAATPAPTPAPGLSGHRGQRYVWQSLGDSAGAREGDEIYVDQPRKDVVEMFDHAPRRVLEIGCASGATAKYLKTRYPQAWMAGIELSEAAVRIARDRLDVVINQKFEDADLEAYGITHGSLDTVILADVLEHIYDPWGVLVRLKPYLSADAQVIASIPNARNLWLMNELAHGRFPYSPVGLLDITHIRFFTRVEIDKLFSETGYAVQAWQRNPTPQLAHLHLQPGMTTVETEKLLLKDVSVEEFEDLKALQFVVRAQPLAAGEQVQAAPRPTAVSQARRGRKRVVVYSLEAKYAACSQIRLLRPFATLGEAWELVWAVEDRDGVGYWDAALLESADLIILHRHFPCALSAELVEAAFASGKPVVYETDDLLTEVPADHRQADLLLPLKPFIEEVARRAQAVVVSTPELAMRMRRFNANVQILPNLVDYHLFHRPPPEPGRQVNIGVVGTSARGGDFALIDEALRCICAEYGKRVRIVFVGDAPAGWKDHANAEFIPFSNDYGGYAARMKGLGLDIGLAPLVTKDFNACKSAIKWLEFSSLGMVGVFSNVPAYAGLVAQGKTGLLVDNQTDKWVRAIKLLIDQPELRLEMALAAQLQVFQEHSLQRGIGRYAEVWNRLLPAESVVEDSPASSQGPDYYALWQLSHAPQEHDVVWMAERMAAWQEPADVHLGVICLPGDEDRLATNLRTLVQQLHAGWRLSIVARSPAPDGIAELARIHWLVAGEEAPLACLNHALATGTETWVGMVEAGDGLPLHATFAVADALQRHPQWRLLYSDEDRLRADGERHTPFFKTDFNLDMLRAAPFSLGGLMLIERDLFSALGGFRGEAEGIEGWDLALRASEVLAEGQIGHLADVLYHRAEGGGHCSREPEAVLAAARDCLGGHLARSGLAATIEDGNLPGTFHIRYALTSEPLVSIIVPTKNRLDLLRNCLTSLIEITGYSRCEILVVDNGSDDPDTLAYLQSLRELGSDSLRVLDYPGAFNFSAMNNRAAEVARGDYLLLLNNDTVVLHADWLEEMLGYAQRSDVGAVGARLLYPDGSIQHAGVVLGLGGVASNHPWQKAAADDPGYFGRLQLPQDYTVLTAACLLTRKAVYDSMGGLDEERFQVNFNDVDYCLKLRERGLKVVWTPYATLHHVESVSQADSAVERVAMDEKRRRLFREVETITGKWRSWFANDPAYNRNLSLILPFQPEVTPALSWDPEWRPRPRVLSIHADNMGCGEYRIIAPMRALSRAGQVQGWDAAGYFHMREFARMAPDSIVFQRQVEPGQIEYIERLGREFPDIFRVFEIDDLITNIPIMSSQKKLFVDQKDINKRFRKAVGLCQRFVVSTDYLAEAYRGYCDEIVVLPNYLERARWDGHAPKRRGGAKARVGWAGSTTHAGDLRLVIDVVKATAEEVDWIFFGMCPDAIRPLVREFHEPVKLDDYAAKLASLDLDLAIAPLEDIPFNHGKSHLRLLEYGVMGYPVICTDITPYRGDYPVTRVASKHKAWLEAIRSQVADRDALARRGDALREYVQAHWMLEDHLDVWLKAWLPG